MNINQIGRWLLVNGANLAVLIASILAIVISFGVLIHNYNVKKLLKQIKFKLGENPYLSIESQIGARQNQSLQEQHSDILKFLGSYSNGLDDAKKFILNEKEEQETLAKLLQSDQINHLDSIDNLSYFEKQYNEMYEKNITQEEIIRKLRLENKQLHEIQSRTNAETAPYQSSNASQKR